MSDKPPKVNNFLKEGRNVVFAISGFLELVLKQNDPIFKI